MKKLIQIGAMFALLVTFSAVSAYAQKAFRYDAHIPFDFSVGQKSYKAGNYTSRVTNPFAATATVSAASATAISSSGRVAGTRKASGAAS